MNTSSDRFAAFSSLAAHTAGVAATDAFVRFLVTQPAESRFDPRYLRGLLGVDDEMLDDLLEAATDHEVRLLAAAPQVTCPRCGERVDALDLLAQEEAGEIAECPNCHEEVPAVDTLAQQTRYRFTPEAAAEVTTAQAQTARRPQLSAVLLCAIDDELDQIMKALRAQEDAVIEAEPGAGSAVYLTARFAGQHVDWTVRVAVTGQTNARAASATAAVLASASPDLILFLGIAGGLDEADLGHVVVADIVYEYELGKETVKGLQLRPLQERATSQLVNWARAVRVQDQWQRRIQPHDSALMSSEPKAHVAPIAAGDKVVATQKGPTYKLIREAAPRAIAVEMEGAGFLAAVFDFPAVPGLLIRGISDRLRGKAQSDRVGWRHQAAANAAAFGLELLSLYEPPPA